MNVLAACSGPDSPVARSSSSPARTTTAASRTTRRSSPRTMRRPHPPRTRDRARHRRGRGGRRATSPTRNPDVDGHGAALRQRRSGPDVRTSHTRCFGAARRCPRSSASTRASSSSTRTTSSAASSTPSATTSPASTTARPTACSRCREVAGLLGKPFAPVLPPWGTGPRGRRLRRVGVRVPPEMLRQLRFGRALDNRRLKATGFRYRYTTRETVLKLARAPAPRAAPARRSGEGYRYEREVEEFLRYSPSVRAADAAPLREHRPAAAAARATPPAPAAAASGRRRRLRRPRGRGDHRAAARPRRRAGSSACASTRPRSRRPRAGARARSTACCRSPPRSARHSRATASRVSPDAAAAGLPLRVDARLIIVRAVAGPVSCVARGAGLRLRPRPARQDRQGRQRRRHRRRRPDAGAGRSAKLERATSPPLQRPIVVHHGKATCSPGPRESQVAADIDAMVDDALAEPPRATCSRAPSAASPAASSHDATSSRR